MITHLEPDILECEVKWALRSITTNKASGDEGIPIPDLEQQTGSKLVKEYIKAVYCHPAYLIHMQSSPCEMLVWMKHKMESRLLGEISIISDMQMTQPYGRKWRTKGLSMKEVSETVGLKLNIQKQRSWYPVPSLHGK